MFGLRGSAIFFFADYMNDVSDVALHFRGVTESGGRETWIAADAPPGHRDFNGGGTYRHLDAPPVVVGSRNWITPAAELEALFFPQVSWILDAVHERIQPLKGYQPRTNQSLAELERRSKAGV